MREKNASKIQKYVGQNKQDEHFKRAAGQEIHAI
jgi:hypothetical protein